jgi:hypothetical protein
MAGKRFHITPNGPKRCTATFRPCDFSAHYGSEESALAADRVIQANNAHRAEVRRLEDNQRNPDPKFSSRSSFSFHKGSTSPRKFGQEIDARINNLGAKPQIYHSMGQFRMNNGNGMEVNMQVMRMTEIDEGFARYTGVWRFLNKSNKVGLTRHPTTNSDLVLDFSTAQAARRSMLQVRDLFRTAVISSGVYDEDEANHRADLMTEDFKNMFNAVESDAAGDFDVYERGMGYFTESDGQNIVVNEKYRTSAFRTENFKNFLAEYPPYRSHQPDVNLRVTDAHSQTGASWTIKKESGQWAVEKTYASGESEVVPITTAQEALDHVYYHNLAEVDPDNEQESLEKGRYAAALMQGVDATLENNKTVIDEWWNKTSTLKSKIANDVHGLESEPKRSLMGKIFETFS